MGMDLHLLVELRASGRWHRLLPDATWLDSPARKQAYPTLGIRRWVGASDPAIQRILFVASGDELHQGLPHDLSPELRALRRRWHGPEARDVDGALWRDEEPFWDTTGNWALLGEVQAWVARDPPQLQVSILAPGAFATGLLAQIMLSGRTDGIQDDLPTIQSWQLAGGFESPTPDAIASARAQGLLMSVAQAQALIHAGAPPPPGSLVDASWTWDAKTAFPFATDLLPHLATLGAADDIRFVFTNDV